MRNDLKTLTLLFRAHKALLDVICDDVRRHGLNVTAFGVLEVLYHKGPQNVRTITERVLVADSSMSYTLNQLVHKGLVERQKNPQDGRGRIVVLTALGHQLMATVYPEHYKRLRERFDRLSEQDEAVLQNLLKRIGT